MRDLQVEAQSMRACADAVQASADALARVHELRAQAADLSAQADSLEKQAEQALEATGCYRPAPAQGPATAAPAAASGTTPAPSLMTWDGSKFGMAEAPSEGN